MFTGLVAERGRLAAAPRTSPAGGKILEIVHSERLRERLELGASLAVAGVCLTIVELHADRSLVEMSPETLRRTTLGGLGAGDPVNLEPALRVGDPLGGHWVQGHVDTTTGVSGRRDLAGSGRSPSPARRAPGSPLRVSSPASENLICEVEFGGSRHLAAHRELEFEIPADLSPYLVEKGSVTVDGVSLTISAITDRTFAVALIPHTLEVTTLSRLAVGDRVNIEVDILAKYVRRAVAPFVDR